MRVRFAEYMTARGYIDQGQAMSNVIETGSFHELIGAIAMSHNLIDMGQLDHILSQLTGDKRFGEVAIELGYMDQPQLDALLQIQDIQEAMEFGESLIVQGLATRVQLLEEMGRFFAQVDSVAAEADQSRCREVDPAHN